MKLRGKRVERLNSFGDSLAIKLKDEGQMRLSPALMSRLKVTADNNKIGIAYPDEGEKDLHIYTAPDGDGVAVNKQGYIKNVPHNRDLRSYMSLSNTGEEDMFVCAEEIIDNRYPGYVFFKIVKVEEEAEWDDTAIIQNLEPIEHNSTNESNIDDSQKVQEIDNEEVKKNKEDDEAFNNFELA